MIEPDSIRIIYRDGSLAISWREDGRRMGQAMQAEIETGEQLLTAVRTLVSCGLEIHQPN